MAYTTADTVKKYLVDSFPRTGRTVDQPFAITGIDYQSFFGGAVESDTVAVKSNQSTVLQRQSVTFSIDRINLSTNPLVPGSIVVASDSSLGLVYTENIDYIVDYGGGDIIRKSTGSLLSGKSVTVWFLPYQLYQPGIDYIINADAGEVKRLVSGSIASDETIYLDYTPVLKPYNDEVVNAAVATANGLVQKEVDPQGDFGADPALQAAATFKALAVICRTSAVRNLSIGNSRAAASIDWIKLADSFDSNAESLLKNFRPSFDSPHSPQKG